MFYPNLIKYYLITNVLNEKDIIFALISGLKKPDKKKHEFMKALDDNGLNKKIDKDFTVDIELIELNETNNILCVPVNAKTNMIEHSYISSGNFNYTNFPFPQKNNTLIFVVIAVVAAIILVIIIFILIKCICCKKSNEDVEQKVLEEKLGGVE